MSWLMVKLDLMNRDCVILGGGSVAARRAKRLVKALAKVTVIAPRICDEIESLGVTIERRRYREGDIAGRFLAVIATDDPDVNDDAAREAADAGVLCNRADVGEEGDIIFPAAADVAGIQLAVSTDCGLPEVAKAVRVQLAKSIDTDWHLIMQIAERYRDDILDSDADDRDKRERIRLLTDPDAVTLLKTRGEDAYHRYCRSIARGQMVAPLAENAHD